MNEKRRARRLRVFNAIRKTPPEPLASRRTPTTRPRWPRCCGRSASHWSRVEQPTQLVEGWLLQIAAQYTTEPVRVVVLLTMLMIQVGNVGYEVDGSTHASLQLDMAGRIDDIASLAAVGAITPADAVAAIEAARTLRPRFGPVLTTIGYARHHSRFRHGDQPDLGAAARLSVPRTGGRRDRSWADRSPA